MNALKMLELAKSLEIDIERLGFGNKGSKQKETKESLFLELVLDEELREKTEKLFMDGHYARAVEEAYKFVDNLVKKRVQKMCKATSGASLMRTALSPNKPLLMLNENLTEVDTDEQQGYMDIFAGCMTGIRNPRAHDTDLEDDQDCSLKLLSWADHLVSRIRKATVNSTSAQE